MRAKLLLTICIGVCVSYSVVVSAQPASDYLTTDLRARVEKLKADLAAEPGNATNVDERARVLWAWANAYALDPLLQRPFESTWKPEPVRHVYGNANGPRGAFLGEWQEVVTLGRALVDNFVPSVAESQSSAV